MQGFAFQPVRFVTFYHSKLYFLDIGVARSSPLAEVPSLVENFFNLSGACSVSFFKNISMVDCRYAIAR